MRLSDDQSQGIRRIVAEHAGADAEVKLFGSRIDDARRGGDGDPQEDHAARVAAHLRDVDRRARGDAAIHPKEEGSRGAGEGERRPAVRGDAVGR